MHDILESSIGVAFGTLDDNYIITFYKSIVLFQLYVINNTYFFVK